MTITSVLNKLESLKATILEDGKIDYDEATVLIDFIEMYSVAGNKPFVKLHADLYRAKEDKVITEGESKQIISDIEDVIKKLKFEKRVETWLAWIGGAILVVSLIWYLI